MHGVRARDGQVIDDAIGMLGQLEVDLAGAGPIGQVEPVVEPVVEPIEPQDLEDDELEDDELDEPRATFTGDDSDTAELRTDELRVPDYERRAVPRGQDDTPTAQLPPQSPADRD